MLLLCSALYPPAETYNRESEREREREREREEGGEIENLYLFYLSWRRLRQPHQDTGNSYDPDIQDI